MKIYEIIEIPRKNTLLVLKLRKKFKTVSELDTPYTLLQEDERFPSLKLISQT